MTSPNATHKTEFSLPSDVEVRATRVFNAPRELVWDAHTKPEHVRNWLLGPEGTTMPVCEIDLRVGGEWHYVWRNPDGSEMEMRGVYRELVRPERIVNSESWGPEWPETVNTLVFAVEGEGTRLTTTAVYPSKDARDAALQTGMTEGWGESEARLARYLESLR